MKTYKYSTKERAERVSKSLGCTGSHSHNEDSKKIFMPCKDMKTFKEKTKKNNSSEKEVTELVDSDGTPLSSKIPITNPANTGTVGNPTTTDQKVGMQRVPRDPLLRGVYGYYRESHIREEDMEGAFGFKDTKFMDYKDTVKYYQKELDMDKDSAIERTVQQGKKPNLQKRAPKKIKKKKNFIDRLILKEKEIEEDVVVNKTSVSDINKPSSNIIKKNIQALKSMAEKEGLSVNDLIRLLKNE
jgi:hypothetical protein